MVVSLWNVVVLSYCGWLLLVFVGSVVVDLGVVVFGCLGCWCVIWFYVCCVIASWTGWLWVVADAVWLLCLSGFLDFVTS